MATYCLAAAAGAALARMGGERAGARRGSLEAGSFEDGFFAAPARGETDRLLRAARDLLDAGRRFARRARADGHVLAGDEALAARLTAGAVRVYEELLSLARTCRGRVFPSYDRIAERTGLGRATVARAVACLEALGFLERRRRFVRVEGEGPGPRLRQTSNAYRPALPARLMRLIARRPAPVPADAQARADDHRDEGERMLAMLPARELAGVLVQGPLGHALARLGATLDARESHGDPETSPQPLHPRSMAPRWRRSWAG
jgi:hypothetical protein